MSFRYSARRSPEKRRPLTRRASADPEAARTGNPDVITPAMSPPFAVGDKHGCLQVSLWYTEKKEAPSSGLLKAGGGSGVRRATYFSQAPPRLCAECSRTIGRCLRYKLP